MNTTATDSNEFHIKAIATYPKGSPLIFKTCAPFLSQYGRHKRSFTGSEKSQLGNEAGTLQFLNETTSIFLKKLRLQESETNISDVTFNVLWTVKAALTDL